MKSFFKLREATAKERWAKEAGERQKKHDEIEAKRVAAAKQGKENMSGAIDKLSHVLYKEEAIAEGHTEFRLDHSSKPTGDVQSTLTAHGAKVSDVTDKATYIKVPHEKAEAFKQVMRNKHNTKLEIAESLEEAKIGDKVQVTHGSQKGLVGYVGEIRKGLGGTNHTYTVDYDENGKRQSVQVKKAHTKLVSEVRSEYSKAAHDEDGRALGIKPGSKPESNPVVKHEVNHYQGKHYISVVHKSGMSYSHKDASGNTQNFASKEAAEKKAAELNKSIKEMVEELKRAVDD